MKLKRIALLVENIYPISIGGMQKHSYYLLKYLAQNHIYVDLYVVLVNAEGIELLHNKLSVTEKRYIAIHVLSIKPEEGYFPGHYLYRAFMKSKYIYSSIKRNINKYDFIYTQGFSGWKLINKKATIKKCPPIGVNFHGLEMFQYSVNVRNKCESLLFRPFVKFILKKADYVLSLGGKINSIFSDLKIPNDKIIVSTNGIEPQWLVNGEDGKPQKLRVYSFIGRYERRKGIEELHKVLRLINGNYNYHFHFIGPIPDKIRLISDKITYWGSLTGETAVKDVLSNSDILVCPSFAEGLPTVILEAMACGLAVIATDVGATNSLVSSKNGWLISPGCIEDLKQSIEESIALDDSTLQKKKAQSKKIVSEGFTWDRVIESTINNINSVLK